MRTRSPLLFPALLALLAAGPARPGLPGEYHGSYATSQGSGDFDLRVIQDTAGLQVYVRATSPRVTNPQFRPAAEPGAVGDSLFFTLNWGGPVRFSGLLVGDTLAGTMIGDDWYGPGSFRTVRQAAATP